MHLIECQDYNAIKLTRDTYELLDYWNMPYVDNTTDDELWCSLKNTDYCYIGEASNDEDTRLYCNRVSSPIDFDSLSNLNEVADLAVYAEIIPINLHFDDGHRCGKSLYEAIKPRRSTIIDTNTLPDWDKPQFLDDDELLYLLISKMHSYDTNPYKKTMDIYCDYEDHCDVGIYH